MQAWVGKEEKLSRDLYNELFLTISLIQLTPACVHALSPHPTASHSPALTVVFVVLCAADSYMFDEPSSYLDVSQRLKAAQTIRSLCSSEKYVFWIVLACLFACSERCGYVCADTSLLSSTI